MQESQKSRPANRPTPDKELKITVTASQLKDKAEETTDKVYESINPTLILVNTLANECLALHAGVKTENQKNKSSQINQVSTESILQGDAPALDLMIQQAI